MWLLICLVIKNLIITELFILGKELNISIIFIMQSYFKVPKNVTKHCTFFYYKNSTKKKQELQQITFNHLPHIEFKDFMSIYKNFTAKVIDATLSSDNLLRSKKNL